MKLLLFPLISFRTTSIFIFYYEGYLNYDLMGMKRMLMHGWPRCWTDFTIIFATRLTILTPASLRDVEKEEGPAGDRINACRKMSGHVRALPDVKTQLKNKQLCEIILCLCKYTLFTAIVFEMRHIKKKLETLAHLCKKLDINFRHQNIWFPSAFMLAAQ